MDKITFDFEKCEIIWDTDGQKGTESVPDLAERKAAILAAAGFESVDLKTAINDMFKELGLDGQITV